MDLRDIEIQEWHAKKAYLNKVLEIRGHGLENFKGTLKEKDKLQQWHRNAKQALEKFCAMECPRPSPVHLGTTLEPKRQRLMPPVVTDFQPGVVDFRNSNPVDQVLLPPSSDPLDDLVGGAYLGTSAEEPQRPIQYSEIQPRYQPVENNREILHSSDHVGVEACEATWTPAADFNPAEYVANWCNSESDLLQLAQEPPAAISAPVELEVDQLQTLNEAVDFFK